MGKPRKSKRQLIRDEKRQKKRQRTLTHADEANAAKRQRLAEEEWQPQAEGEGFIPIDDDLGQGEGFIPIDDDLGPPTIGSSSHPEREFFGMLTDEEQEYFRRADELLEVNDFPSPDDRDNFLDNVYNEAKGKELKLASSQSCSRLMERLILLSTAKQKKRLFEAFASHFVSLVTHRFASHCCEQLFLQSAAVVTQELAGNYEVAKSEDISEDQPQTSMEDLFLFTLDELEDHLTYLLSDKFGSHTLRVILVVLSGRSLEQASTKSLLQSKRKEHIKVYGGPSATSEGSSQLRHVPESFTVAIQKIVADSTATLDATALRVLATHPTGNPVLQLLLELDLALNPKSKAKKPHSKSSETTILGTEGIPSGAKEQPDEVTLLDKLLPGAPSSLSDEQSTASAFVNSMLYDPIGSRLLETLISHVPGKIFKALYANIFGPRIHTFLRNDIAGYPAIKVLNRLSKEDLADAVQKTLPTVPVLIEKCRFNVLRALFERCDVRHANSQIETLLGAVCDAFGSETKHLVPKLCSLEEELAEKQEGWQQSVRNRAAALSHGSQLIVTLLGVKGTPSKAIQASLSSLKPEQLLQLATTSTPTANILITALKTPSKSLFFHKSLVAALLPHVVELANSQYGHNILNAVIATPSKGEDIAVPFHLKEAAMTRLADNESEIRGSWTGRNVWRTWKGALWRHRRSDWVQWAKEVDPEEARVASTPRLREDGDRDSAHPANLGRNRGRAQPAH